MNLSNLFTTVLVTGGTLLVYSSGKFLPGPIFEMGSAHANIADTIIPVKSIKRIEVKQ